MGVFFGFKKLEMKIRQKLKHQNCWPKNGFTNSRYNCPESGGKRKKVKQGTNNPKTINRVGIVTGTVVALE